MSDAPVIVEADLLRDYARLLLQAGGFRPGDAAGSADLLVWANLRGVDSHGVLRIPRYVEMVEQGQINPDAEPRIIREHGAVAIADADLAPAASGMTVACEKAVEIARSFGVGVCAARRITHAGAIGYFAKRIADAGMVGLVVTASRPLMAYPGARGEAISTNPIAIAAPCGAGRDSIVLDMSTAAVALGKIMVARDTGKPLSPGWAVDAQGRMTTDAAQVDALLPMAGYKGAGLSLMIEILASVLSGNPIIATALEGGRPEGFNGLVIALDPAAFGTPDVIVAEVARLVDAIRALPPVEGGGAVLLPGERGSREAAMRDRDGIPVAAGTMRNLDRLAAKLGVRRPASIDPCLDPTMTAVLPQ